MWPLPLEFIPHCGYVAFISATVRNGACRLSMSLLCGDGGDGGVCRWGYTTLIFWPEGSRMMHTICHWWCIHLLVYSTGGVFGGSNHEVYPHSIWNIEHVPVGFLHIIHIQQFTHETTSAIDLKSSRHIPSSGTLRVAWGNASSGGGLVLGEIRRRLMFWYHGAWVLILTLDWRGVPVFKGSIF